MKSAVIFATRSGNTRQVAEAIADVLREQGSIETYSVEHAPASLDGFDLAVIGGPTEGHGVTPPMTAYLDALEATSVKGRLVAVFDTRLAWPRVLAGSAAEGIARRLSAEGAVLVAGPESFIVSMKPELQPGELDHARRWARELSVGQRR